MALGGRPSDAQRPRNAPHVPHRKPRPRGGRPPADDRTVRRHRGRWIGERTFAWPEWCRRVASASPAARECLRRVLPPGLRDAHASTDPEMSPGVAARALDPPRGRGAARRTCTTGSSRAPGRGLARRDPAARAPRLRPGRTSSRRCYTLRRRRRQKEISSTAPQDRRSRLDVSLGSETWRNFRPAEQLEDHHSSAGRALKQRVLRGTRGDSPVCAGRLSEIGGRRQAVSRLHLSPRIALCRPSSRFKRPTSQSAPPALRPRDHP